MTVGLSATTTAGSELKLLSGGSASLQAAGMVIVKGANGQAP